MTSTTARTGTRRRLALALVVVVTALAAGGLSTLLSRRHAGGLSTLLSRRHAGPSAADPALSAAVSAVIPGLEAFVESARGLQFLAPVKVSVLGDAAFRRKYDEGGSTGGGSTGGSSSGGSGSTTSTRTLRVLGLYDTGGTGGGGGGQASSGGGSDADSVDGFYDSDTKELVVRGTKPTPFVRQVLVHELTHALDDQHFGIDPPVADDEAGMADDALVEGDATAIEYRYVATLSPEEQREAAAEDNAAGGTGSPDPSDPFAELDDFPYADGPTFIAALVAAGGQARVDDAFRNPPTTSAEILHPDRYLSGKGRAPVPDVPADAKVDDQGVIGEYLLGLVLEETVPQAVAERAAAGWAGDHYVAWRSGRRTCVRATVVFDTPADAGELTSALQQWAGNHGGTTVGPAGPADVTMTRCA